MAAKCNNKSSDVELVARLCRLDFYKRQKNWKLCQDLCKKSLEPVPEPELGEGSKSNNTNSNNQDSDEAPSNLINYAICEPDPAEIPSADPEWQSTQQNWNGNELRDMELGGEEAYSPENVEDLRTYETACAYPAEATGAEPIAPGGVMSTADDWMRWPNEPDARSDSMDSVLSFMRGAAASPHSTILDFTYSSDHQLSGEKLAGLSWNQLATRVRRHTIALRLLLDEVRARAVPRQRSLISVDFPLSHSFEELATSNLDLYRTTNSFVAGSFRNRAIGRGRGRLYADK